MRNFLAVVALALVGVPAASGATLAVVPRIFSPSAGSLAVSGSAAGGSPIGVQLASTRGVALGWIREPASPQPISLYWDGRLNGVLVEDGSYVVRLVAQDRVVARAPIRIDSVAPSAEGLSADNGSAPFAGDGPLLTTITPNGDGLRDRARIRFQLDEAAAVTLEVSRTVTTRQAPVSTLTARLGPGERTMEWRPPTGLGPRTYVLHLTLVDGAGNAHEYGADSPYVGRFARAPVVRLMGIDAAFTEPSYAAEELAVLRIATDASDLSLQFFRSGPEHVLTGSDSVMNGVAVGPQVRLDWRKKRDAPRVVRLGLGPWPSGLYYAELTAPDGRVGYAPFVLRPPTLGAHRVAVVLPAATWQAYNFWDGNGDGFGDTWYAGGPHRSVELGRPYLRRGVIPFFRRYDLNFLHWLAWNGKEVDYLTDTDLDATGNGGELAAAYDLIVFPGHTEYVSNHLYDVIEQYRDLGGNLAFLSANGFFWRTVQDGSRLRRTGHWRDLGRPEGTLIGVQYIANDEGRRQGVFIVRDPSSASWLWDKTGLEAGGTFGEFVGGYGIEIDATGPWSPPGTQVLAEIPNLFGAGMTAQMTYYETPAGAKVFAAGALDFGGSATYWPISRVLENLWARLSSP